MADAACSRKVQDRTCRRQPEASATVHIRYIRKAGIWVKESLQPLLGVFRVNSWSRLCHSLPRLVVENARSKCSGQ